MKLVSILLFCLLSFSAFGATVKVGSFNYIRTSQNFSSPLAELCGSVSGATSSPTFVRVHVDPQSSNSAIYNTLAGDDGKFCLALITYRGRAEVSLIGQEGSTTAFIK